REEEPRAVYLCIDNSGSMAGEKEVWAKASALALAHLALAEDRPVEVVLFGDAADPLRVVSMRPADDASTRLEKLLDVASYFLGGGTDFVKPLSHVLEAIEAQHYTGNDLLFVSDGLGPIPEEFVRRFLEAKARFDLRMTSVLIGEEPFALSEISDTVHRLDEALEAGEALAAHFASAFLERGHESGRSVRPPLRPGRATPLLFDHFLPGADEP
ncbi:MAG TPA: VWA domain-containing protein, partial [Thermoplasmata archaeon]|nr:VWA domain-containing protein [Thermoplasmata archaeon]